MSDVDLMARLENLEARLALAVARAEALADELSGLVAHTRQNALDALPPHEPPTGNMVRLASASEADGD